MALEEFFEPVYVQDWISKPDGFGGIIWGLGDGAKIDVGFIQNQSIEARVAEFQGIRNIYTIVTRPGSGLEHQDVVRRVRDGAKYRITSDFNVSPNVADEEIAQASAEKVVES